MRIYHFSAFFWEWENISWIHYSNINEWFWIYEKHFILVCNIVIGNSCALECDMLSIEFESFIIHTNEEVRKLSLCFECHVSVLHFSCFFVLFIDYWLKVSAVYQNIIMIVCWEKFFYFWNLRECHNYNLIIEYCLVCGSSMPFHIVDLLFNLTHNDHIFLRKNGEFGNGVFPVTLYVVMSLYHTVSRYSLSLFIDHLLGLSLLWVILGFSNIFFARFCMSICIILDSCKTSGSHSHLSLPMRFFGPLLSHRY